MDPIKIKSGLEELMTRLESGNKPMLSEERKAAMKHRLMNKIKLTAHQRVDHSVFSLVGAVRCLSDKVELSLAKKVEIKERIMDKIEQMPQRRFFFSFSLLKKMVSAAMVLVLAFGMLSFLSVETYVVHAGVLTAIDSLQGDVSIQRNESFIPASAGMVLMENDKVVTGKDGAAVIRYFDNSVSRMSSNTELKINKLVNTDDRALNTYVEVDLLAGKIWSRVLNLVESDSTFVVKANNVSTEAKKAAFNVEVDNGKVEVGVFNHAVSINAAGKTEQVLSGEKLVVDKNVPTIGVAEKDSGWVKENLKNDHEYLTQVEQRLIDAKRKAVGLDLTADVSYNNSLKEDTLLFLTFDDVKKKEFDLDLAERSFVAAQVKLNDPNISAPDKADAEAALQKFGDKLKDFYKMVGEIDHTDKEYAKELRDYADAKVLLQKKGLNMALPDSPNYMAKNILDDAQLVGTDNEIDKLKLRMDQAADKLATAEDAKDSGKTELASKAVADYKKDITGVVTMIDSLPKASPEVKDELVTKVSDNIDLLKAMEVVPSQQVADLQNTLKKPEVVVTALPATPVNTAAPAITAAPVNPTAVESAPVVEEPQLDPTKVVDGPYGVQMKGDKPLSPLLEDVK